MVADTWKSKIEWHIEKAVEAINENDKIELAYRASIIGENVINILRLVVDFQTENNFFMITMSMKKFMSLGILSKDYLPALIECYEFYKSGTYVSLSTNTFTFQEAKDCYDEISNLVKDVEDYLKKEGKM